VSAVAAIAWLAATAHRSLPHRLAHFLVRPLTIVLLILLVACSLTLATLRRRAVRRRADVQRSEL
jgi:hypothetical protein